MENPFHVVTEFLISSAILKFIDSKQTNKTIQTNILRTRSYNVFVVVLC